MNDIKTLQEMRENLSAMRSGLDRAYGDECRRHSEWIRENDRLRQIAYSDLKTIEARIELHERAAGKWIPESLRNDAAYWRLREAQAMNTTSEERRKM